jgi:hypothetical protein
MSGLRHIFGREERSHGQICTADGSGANLSRFGFETLIPLVAHYSASVVVLSFIVYTLGGWVWIGAGWTMGNVGWEL